MRMRLRQSESIGLLVTLAGITALLGLTTVPVAGQVPSETPWGHPDLQGVWASDSATPLERLSVLGNREFLTDEEVALLQQKALPKAPDAAIQSLFLELYGGKVWDGPKLAERRYQVPGTCTSQKKFQKKFARISKEISKRNRKKKVRVYLGDLLASAGTSWVQCT